MPVSVVMSYGCEFSSYEPYIFSNCTAKSRYFVGGKITYQQSRKQVHISNSCQLFNLLYQKKECMYVCMSSMVT